MSVLSRILLSKKAAKQHKEKGKEKEREVPPATTTYIHVPTHAAFDALNGAPPSWSHSDRPKIKAQHRRRSQMAISRTESSLSTVTMSHMNSTVNPQIHSAPRSASYHGHNPTWFDREGTNLPYDRNEPAPKRQKPARGYSFHDSGIGPSPLASNVQSEEVSPAMSSGNSTSSKSNSDDNLEMARSKRQSLRQQPTVYGAQDIFHKLHTSTTRKLGEAPLYDSPPVLHKAPIVTATPVVPQQKEKRRWSLMGKKNVISAV